MRARATVFVHSGRGRNVEIERFAASFDVAIAARVGQDDFAAWRAHAGEAPSIVTALDPQERRALAERILAAGGTIATLARTGESIWPQLECGIGTILADGPLNISFATTLGRHAIIMPPVCVGHDIAVGDFVTIYPSVSISGYVTIEDDVVLGPGSIVANGTSRKALRLGRGARLAAGAVVTKSVPAGVTVAGNPARVTPA
jgi:hypothetical protein